MESRVLRYHAGDGLSGAQVARFLRSLVLDKEQPDDSGSQKPAPRDLIALAWIRDGNGPNTMIKLLRYQNSLERSFYRALHQLQALRQREDPLPPDPQSDTLAPA